MTNILCNLPSPVTQSHSASQQFRLQLPPRPDAQAGLPLATMCWQHIVEGSCDQTASCCNLQANRALVRLAATAQATP
jgi:hypothetical protein